MMKVENMGPGREAGAQLGSDRRLCSGLGAHLPGPLSSSRGGSGLFPSLPGIENRQTLFLQASETN